MRLVGLCGVEAALEAGVPDILALLPATEEVVEGGIEVHGRIAKRCGVGLLEPKVAVLVQAGVLERCQHLAGDAAHGLRLWVVGLVDILLPDGLAVGVLHVLGMLCVGICARCELGAAERLLGTLPGFRAEMQEVVVHVAARIELEGKGLLLLGCRVEPVLVGQGNAVAGLVFIVFSHSNSHTNR